MSDSNNRKFTLKAVINKQKTRVLFAELDNNIVNVLLGFSMQPFGLIVQALQKHYGDKTPVIGSLNSLYNSFTKFSSVKRDLQGSLVKRVFAYAFPFGTTDFFSDLPWNCFTENEYFWVLEIFSQRNSNTNTPFIIFDDLRIVAIEKASILETLNNVGVAIEDMDGIVTRTATLGVNEIMDFLVRLLISPYPLSDIILGSAGTGVNSEVAKPGISLPHIQKDSTSNKEMILKLMIQKSTNKKLFALQADCVFVNYLFSMLKIPLGRVDGHLGGNTCLNNIGTLYRSSTALARKYLRDSDTTSDETNFPLKKVFVDGMYMVNDDLTVSRFSVVSSISMLDELKVSLSDVEELELQIGLEEVFGILKASLTSTRALTDGLINSGLKRQLKPKQEN